ncbi:AraC-like DNA-binding protein [Tenacibaculum lutimaris]|uniref:AraC-like DNA-binding protein n=1 Tax=Tenacibaculum lutimaris TaxID=285258 RepID=A0A420DZ41_9FLAO|nr:AraC family transcriptional regulator [Tenacibaculum lutimaris]RKF03101.1 AraC-like DNA-binding protein [Tenacibaculum lutimaris]
MKKSVIILFLFTLTVIKAQGKEVDTNKRFDSIFYDTAVRISAIDMKRAEIIADSLFKASISDIHKIKSLMLSASLLEKQSKREQAIEYALKADEIASLTSHYRWIARIYGFLATQFRLIGLVDYSKQYLEKGERNSKKIEDKNQADICLGMVFQEKAHHAINEKEFTNSISLLNDANRLFEVVKNEHTKNLFIGINSEMIGRSYVELKNKDSARYYYEKSLTYLNKIGLNKSEYSGLVFHGKAHLYLEEGKLEQSKIFLDKAHNIATAANQKNLLELIYRDLSRYYKRKNNNREYSVFYEKYLNIKEENNVEKRKATNAEVNRIFENQQKGFLRLYWYIIAVGILLLIALIMLFYKTKEYKRKREIFEATILKFREKELSRASENKSNEKCKESKERLMTIETEMILLKKLEEFELKEEYKDPKLTLAKLSTILNTNTKYLSWIINEYKKNDFNNYINHLRIYYIVKKMQTDSNYLNYKISYLSSECGFSSHSKFTAVFKKEIGLTPSFFINELRKE